MTETQRNISTGTGREVRTKGIERNAGVVWTGDLRRGQGVLGVGSGVIQDVTYTYATRFENAPGTNPEELLAAAHAACYSMALAGELTRQGHTPEQVQTRATCTVAPQPGGGWKITRMHLDVQATAPGLDQATFEQVAQEAERNCPVSNVIRNGLQIELNAVLKQ